MSMTLCKITAAITAICAASLSFAQDPAANTTENGAATRPAVAFPPTPTPAPKAEPMTQEQLDTFIIPTQFLARTSNVLCIVHNGFRRSQIDPCGCVTNQLGGLDKEAHVIKRIEEHKIPSIQVDAGGIVRDMPNDGLLEQSKGVLRGLGQIGYEAVNIAFTDLALSIDDLKAISSESNLSLISANILDQNNNPIFDPYVIKEVTITDGSTLKVGIIGVTRPRVELSGIPMDEPTSATAGTGPNAVPVKISDPTAALDLQIAEIADQTDLIIALVYDRRTNAERIVNSLSNKESLDVLVTGENSQLQGNAQAIGNVQVVSGGYEGRQVGTLYLDLKDNGIASTWSRHIEILQTIPPLREVTTIMEATHKKVEEVQPAEPAPTRLEL